MLSITYIYIPVKVFHLTRTGLVLHECLGIIVGILSFASVISQGKGPFRLTSILFFGLSASSVVFN